MIKTVCIIQARMGSTRLPGKVLLPILERPMLWWDVYRVQQSRLIDDIIIATTTQTTDDAIVDLCHQHKWQVSRGSEDDVLDRYYQAMQASDADYIVRITSDCPLIDPAVIDYTIATLQSTAPQHDYASNTFGNRTYPRGLDTEVFTRATLERAWHEATQAHEREHVTPYIWQNPSQFKLLSVQNQQDFSSHRWTVDTPEDLQLVRMIYQHFGQGDFLWQDVLKVLQDYPEWSVINQHIEQKKL
ncbi:glycosyltransferase family protein [Anaerolineales bacterium]